mmetsp:Transcript_4148/g.15644  ORF Transcript_4148/g.15644 Transcript_4148/m.15644 type:complete len:121 (+) Transcript_4148:1157-1519(+)
MLCLKGATLDGPQKFLFESSQIMERHTRLIQAGSVPSPGAMEISRQFTLAFETKTLVSHSSSRIRFFGNEQKSSPGLPTMMLRTPESPSQGRELKAWHYPLNAQSSQTSCLETDTHEESC